MPLSGNIIPVSDKNGPAIHVATVFTSHLTLPPEIIVELGLPLLGSRNILLADGGRVALDVHRVRVLWDSRRRLMEVLATRGGALAGASLIWGHQVNLSAAEGGGAIIEPHRQAPL